MSYFDNAATTKLEPRVLEQMNPFLTGLVGNPSSLHRPGQEAHHALNKSRSTIAQLLGVESSEIIFTSGATESIHTSMRGLIGKGHIITTVTEHSATLEACGRMEEQGWEITYLKPDSNGLYTPEQVKSALRKDTKLVSIHMVNNEIGAIQPIGEIGNLLQHHTTYFHVDATQAFHIMECSREKLHWDMLTLAGHKIHGPEGIGILALRENVDLIPLIPGNQEFSMRGGTQAVSLAVGLAKAMEICEEERDTMKEHLADLHDHLVKQLKAYVPDCQITGDPRYSCPSICHVRFGGISGETLMLRLDLDGIAVSTGSACSSSEEGPSRVLLAMDIPEEDAVGSIRISFSKWNTVDEVDKLVESIAFHVGQIRHMNITY